MALTPPQVEGMARLIRIIAYPADRFSAASLIALGEMVNLRISFDERFVASLEKELGVDIVPGPGDGSR